MPVGIVVYTSFVNLSFWLLRLWMMYPVLLVSWPKTRDIHLLFSMARWNVQWVSGFARSVGFQKYFGRTEYNEDPNYNGDGFWRDLGYFGMKNLQFYCDRMSKWKSLLSHLCLRPPLMVLLICLNVIKANFYGRWSFIWNGGLFWLCHSAIFWKGRKAALVWKCCL